MFLCNDCVQGGIDSFVCIWCSSHVGYPVLCRDDAMYMWCCVHVVHVVLCTYGVMCIIVQLVLCACGVMYMLYKWHCVQVVLIFGSIRCALAMKIGGEAKAHKISNTQKLFGEIPPR